MDFEILRKDMLEEAKEKGEQEKGVFAFGHNLGFIEGYKECKRKLLELLKDVEFHDNENKNTIEIRNKRSFDEVRRFLQDKN